MADIGIKKTRMGINLAFVLIFVALVIVCAIMWGKYQANYTNEYYLENGVEVEAVGVEWHFKPQSSHEGPNSYDYGYYVRYKYTDLKGEEQLVRGGYMRKEEAQAQIGKTITLILDPRDDKVRFGSLKNIRLTYKQDLILATVFCFPVPLALYLLIYRGIYRSAINYKIRKKVGDNDPDFMGGKRYNTDAIKTGEVTNVWKWIVCYVKVKYQDENGATKEKWARAWFTHKEAKYLQQKKMITIVPYKNTYGILEKLSAK